MMDALFLDFDGVMCDSVDECFASSWIAYQERLHGNIPPAVHISDYQSFKQMRPFIRSGRDFILIQKMIADGVSVRTQKEFDEIAAGVDPGTLAEYDAALYAVREGLVARDRDFWLPLNKPYPPLDGALRAAAASPDLWVVSTKRPAYIELILGHWGIDWDPARIRLPAGGEDKIGVITAIMRNRGYRTGMFVDDQADHLRCAGTDPLECRLARWGTIRLGAIPSAPLPEGVSEISLGELCRIVRSFESAHP